MEKIIDACYLAADAASPPEEREKGQSKGEGRGKSSRGASKGGGQDVKKGGGVKGGEGGKRRAAAVQKGGGDENSSSLQPSKKAAVDEGEGWGKEQVGFKPFRSFITDVYDAQTAGRTGSAWGFPSDVLCVRECVFVCWMCVYMCPRVRACLRLFECELEFLRERGVDRPLMSMCRKAHGATMTTTRRGGA